MREGSYLDTSFMLKFYLLEPDSEEAIVWLVENRSSVFVSPLTQVEVITSFSREDSEGVARRAINNYLDDLAANVYLKLQIDAEVFALAVEIAERSARQYRLRSLDVLHLATALRHSVPEFGTYDKRLREAAMAMGLRVIPERS